MTSRNFFLPRDDVTEKQEIEYQIMIPKPLKMHRIGIA